MKLIATALALLIACSASADVYDVGGPRTTNNDDTCDIAQLPAATLLLPYFEVDLENRNRESTLFSITNVTNVEQIAHVTLWTDLAYPVVTFDIYLTGYDVQSINLYDVIKLGRVAPHRGTGSAVSEQGEYSDRNPALSVSACESVPATLDAAVVTRMQQAFTTGVVGTCRRAGLAHANAIGYATIDVVSACNSMLTPEDRAYYEGMLRFDNVLTGETFQVNSAENYAQGSPLVHIRAIPDGATKAFPYERTFYGRYQRPETPFADGRQPLPTTFATRWISGGTGGFATSLKIWRERVALSDRGCRNSDRQPEEFTEAVRFDDQENAVSVSPTGCPMTCFPPDEVLAAASRTSVESEPFPKAWNSAVDGWLYLNLDSRVDDQFGTQAWVVSSMRAEGRYSADTDAIALGNGCSTAPDRSEVAEAGGDTIAPAWNEQVSGNNDDTCDIALAPAATLLLPWFEVDTSTRSGETTVFSITNADPADQIAHVTLWNTAGSPVLAFDVFLTGYDVQSINLYDVIVVGSIAAPRGTGRAISRQGDFSGANGSLNMTECERLPGGLPKETAKRVYDALTRGDGRAVGYATIDVVSECGSLLTPADPAYYRGTLRYDNVLMGEYVQSNGGQNYAQGSPMVHIRAIPEGGTFASRASDPLHYSVNFPRTFYSRYQTSLSKVTDGRQPLPSTFAARWLGGGTGLFETHLKIWVQGTGKPVIADVVTFDEEENAVGLVPHCSVGICTDVIPRLPIAGRLPHGTRFESDFPHPRDAIGGWMYLNLDDPEHEGASQAWVISSLRAEGRYSTDMNATALGNGCSPAIGRSEASNSGGIVIGPAANLNP